ncbi:MAG: DUF2971 domain-containing protein [Planctomycetes bacterium]|nr:DUF2971 domain-containing protein [Planctomycetota bacterium]
MDNHFRTDDERALAHFKTRKEHPPEVLYHYTSLKSAISIIKTCSIRMGSPKNSNDPFECFDPFWQLKTPGFLNQLREIYRQNLTGPIEWHATPKEMRQAIADERKRLAHIPHARKEAELQTIIDRLIQDLVEEDGGAAARYLLFRLRSFSLSESSLSSVMWSHYGDAHRGVAIGFCTNVLEAKWRRPIERVRYTPTPPILINNPESWLDRLSWSGTPAARPTPDTVAWTCSKHIEWAYEKEWRFAWLAPRGEAKDHGFFKFPPDAVNVLITGLRCPDHGVSDLANACSGMSPSPTLIRTRPSKTTFNILLDHVIPQIKEQP